MIAASMRPLPHETQETAVWPLGVVGSCDQFDHLLPFQVFW
jgi:hypothetical protein